MSERILQANSVDICTETFGGPADPALILNYQRDTSRPVTYKPSPMHAR